MLIDRLLAVAAALPAGAVLGFMMYASKGNVSRGESELMFYGLIGLIALMVLAFMGYQWYLIATTGQSLAKH